MLAPLPAGVPQPIAWGMNCGIGPDGLLGAVEQAVRLTALPLVVQPNAGMPQGGREPADLLLLARVPDQYAKRYVSLGASAVGGCCGTTPEHIREVALAVKPLARAQVKPVASTPAEAVEPKPPAPLAEKSQLGRAAGRPRSGSPPSNCCRRGATTSTDTIDKSQDAPAARRRRDQHPRRPPGQLADLAAGHGPAHPAGGAASRRSCTSAAATAT